MLNKTIGVCGYFSSGASAVTDLLREFDDARVLDRYEFPFIYYPDGLSDLDWHLNANFRKTFSSLPIQRFRKLTRSRGHLAGIEKKLANDLTERFLRKIVQVRWHGLATEERGSLSWFYSRALAKLLMVVCRLTKPKRIPERLFQVFFPKREISVRPRNFDAAAKEYINALLDSMGRDESKTTVIDQLFCANNPAKGFKYVDNPKAVVVDRDPRDCYLFCKIFLKSRGAGLYAATDTVEDFISWFKAMRTEPDGLREREDILFMNFEELLYDYDNSVPKIAEFCGVSRHTAKGEFFKPKWSRNNSQLFKKYKGYEEDIGKIEKELPDYLFPFEKYPDIETEGEMFFGNQSKRGRI